MLSFLKLGFVQKDKESKG